MLEENRTEFEKAGILKWWQAGYKGQGMKIAVLEISEPWDNPCSFVAEALGCNVDYEPKSRKILITR